MDLPFVSVIIPVYNESGFIEHCLDAFQRQTYPSDHFEILVIDGMSTDGCREEIQRVADADPRVRLIDNPRRVAAAAANEGILAARGDVLCFLSAHGEPDEDYISTSVRVLQETGAGGVGGRYIHVGRDPVANAIGLAMSSPFGMASPHRVSDAPGEADTISHPTFRREVFDAVGGYNESLLRNEDYELNYRVREAGYTLVFSPEISSVYRPRRSLGALARQFYDYGIGKAAVVRMHPRSVRPRHVVPPLAVIGLAASPVLVFASTSGAVLVASGAVAYAGVVAAALIQAQPSRHGARRSTFALAIPVMHVTWGAGVLLGLRRPLPRSRSEGS